MIQNERSNRKVIPIASGKGGVGKSVLAANLALRLSAAGADTVAVDLDLGGSNLHTYFGIRNTRKGIGNFLSASKTPFSDIVTDTDWENLRFVPGDVLVAGLSRLSSGQRNRVVTGLEELKADYIIVDLGSGTSELVIDLFLLSNSGIVVTTPQAPSALNAYGLLKNVLFYRLKEEFAKSSRITSYLRSVQKDRNPRSTPTLDEIVKAIKKIDGKAATRARRRIADLHPLFILNMVNDPDDLSLLRSLRKLVNDNLGIDPACLGAVFFDPTCTQAVTSLQPVTTFDPLTAISYQIERIAQKIFQSERFPEMPLDLSEYEDSYELTQLELEDDVEQYGRPSNFGGDRNAQEFFEVISKQKQEIEQLKRTIRMLSTGRE